MYYDLGEFLRRMVGFLLLREGRPIFGVIPYLLFFNYSKEDKEYAQNLKTVRAFCESLINDRRSNPLKDSNDLMTIWLTDDLYKTDTKLIVDEVILMFLAGSFTLKTTNTNMLSYLALNP